MIASSDFCYRISFLSDTSICHQIVQHISSILRLSGALGGLSLGLTAYALHLPSNLMALDGLARHCLTRESFTEFTRLSG